MMLPPSLLYICICIHIITLLLYFKKIAMYSANNLIYIAKNAICENYTKISLCSLGKMVKNRIFDAKKCNISAV